METRYQFKSEMLNIHKKDRRDFSLAPREDETELKNGLCLVIPKDAGVVTLTAVRDFVDYLFTSMNVSAMMSSEGEQNAIKIALNQDIEDASGYMGYRITVKDDGITLEGYDERGIAQGLYYLEDLMSVRKAPFLTKGVIKRKALFSPRSTHSPFGMFEYTDAALSMISHYGMDTIELWLKDPYTTKRGDFIDLLSLANRAERYGIDLNVSLYTPHNKHPEESDAQEFYDKLYGDLFKACPKVKYITIVGESAQFASRDPKAGKSPHANNFNENIPTGKPAPGWWPCEDYPAWLTLIKNSIDKYSKDAKIIFYTYNWGYTPEEDRIKLIENLPDGIAVQPTWDMFQQYKVGDTVQDIVDYSLCLPGPGDYFISEAKAISKRKGLKLTVNAQCSGRTWDFGVVPYEPMPGQWIKRYEGMVKAHEEFGLSGVTENIHYGFYPSFILDIEKQAFFSNSKPLAEVLEDVLYRDFDENANAVKKACDFFDEAITHYIPTNEDQYGAYRIGPAYPLWLEPTTASTGNIPQGGRRPTECKAMFGSGIYFPIYNPEITGRNSPTGVRINEEIKQNQILADLMLKGIEILDACENPNDNLLKLTNLAKFIYRCAITTINVKKHYILKQQFSLASNREDAAKILDDVEKLIYEERENVLATIPLSQFDSRLGWEPSMEYTTDEAGLDWKLRQLDHELNFVLPRFRKSNDLILNIK